ncbi:N-acetyltransferase domain-containing protein [Mycena chlorophos]|uniref:N-acetyltransferase domain-containing protein n=1 Tax=Mycena chlorophos TaxID=658473 RepID=A0A8H6S2V3_MYCCL|nr:N-acetyltransferase domain-containing protein [Mycena chlorophos]
MPSSSPSITIATFDPSLSVHKALIPAITSIHIACIETDGTISTFAPPLNRERMERWWTGKLEDVRDGSRVIFLAFDAAENDLVGFVVLHRPMLETGPFKASVEKLMVSPAHRRLGIGRKLMERLETDAKALGQTLILDTDEGSAAESLYTTLGYNILGVIPEHGISPLDGSLKGSTFFWKRL